MRVINIEWKNFDAPEEIYRIWFEHDGVRWFKYFNFETQDDLVDFLNSVIEDAVVRGREIRKGPTWDGYDKVNTY